MENASEPEAARMSIQTKDLIRYNNHITYYKKNHSDFIQKSHYNSTNRQQNPSIYFVRQPEIFSLFKAEEMRGGKHSELTKPAFPPRAPPFRARSCCALWGCVYVCRWRGDGFCGVGCGRLCRFFYSATGWTVALYFQGTYLILVKRIFAIRFATWLYTK